MSISTGSGGMVNAFDGDPSRVDPKIARLIERRAHLLGPAYRLFYEEPVHLVRGEGVWLYDAEEQPYLDVYNNVASIGHCHPRVVAAIQRQVATLNTHTRYLHETILDYAERLLATFPRALGQILFTCTGSEANDLALRIAEAATGGTGVIVTSLAYHGLTHAVSGISPSLGAHVARGADVWTVPAPDSEGDANGVGSRFAAGVAVALAEMQQRGVRPAALFCDTIFSSDGIFSDPPGFLREAVDAVRTAGGLFVADEVQPGFGRTGQAMWGFARHGVVPDMVSLGKPMGNGHPIAGLVARPEIVAEFGANARYFNTFGGNPVSCAAGLATLSAIEEDGLMANALSVGGYLGGRLSALAARDSRLADIRGAGLFLGVEIRQDGVPDPALAARIVNGLRRRHVLISATGPSANVLKIRPPLIFTRDHADFFVAALAAELDDVQTTT